MTRVDIENFKYQDPEFYVILSDESEEGLSEVPLDHTKLGKIRKPALGGTDLCVF